MTRRAFFIGTFFLASIAHATLPSVKDYASCVNGDFDFNFDDQFPPNKDQGHVGMCGDQGETALFAWSVGVESGQIPDVSPQWAACRRMEQISDQDAQERSAGLRHPDPKELGAFLSGSTDEQTLTALKQSDRLAIDNPKVQASFEEWFKLIDQAARKKKLNATKERCQYLDGMIKTCTAATTYVPLSKAERESFETRHLQMQPMLSQRKEVLDLLDKYGEPRVLLWLGEALRTRFLTPEGWALWEAAKTPADLEALDKIYHDRYRRNDLLKPYAADKTVDEDVINVNFMLKRFIFAHGPTPKQNLPDNIVEIMKTYEKENGGNGTVRDFMDEVKNVYLPKIGGRCEKISHDLTRNMLKLACRGVAVAVSTRVSGVEWGPAAPLATFKPMWIRTNRADELHKMTLMGVQKDAATGVKYLLFHNSWGDEGAVTRMPFDRACLIFSAYTFLGDKGRARAGDFNGWAAKTEIKADAPSGDDPSVDH